MVPSGCLTGERRWGGGVRAGLKVRVLIRVKVSVAMAVGVGPTMQTKCDEQSVSHGGIVCCG